MLTNSLRYCLCCRHWSLLTCKISNRYFKRRNKEKTSHHFCCRVANSGTKIHWSCTAHGKGGARALVPGTRHRLAVSKFPACPHLQGTHLAVHSGNFKPSKGNKVIVIMIASKHHSCGLTASGCGRLDETDCDSQEIRN